jgi:hypothetical protein
LARVLLQMARHANPMALRKHPRSTRSETKKCFVSGAIVRRHVATMMERMDSRRLPVAVLNERRRREVMLRLSGMTVTQVCALAELARATVIAAVWAYRRGGW